MHWVFDKYKAEGKRCGGKQFGSFHKKGEALSPIFILNPELNFLNGVYSAGGERCSSRHQRESRPSRAGNRQKVAQEWAPIHNGVQCDRCGVCPIQGPRYNSQVGELIRGSLFPPPCLEGRDPQGSAAMFPMPRDPATAADWGFYLGYSKKNQGE